MAYDPKKAELFNQLRRQGLSEDAAILQSGITDAEINNYSIGLNGELGALIIGAPTSLPIIRDTGNQELSRVDYDQDPSGFPAQQPSKTPVTYTTTSTKEVSGGGSTTVVSNNPVPTPASRALQPAIDAKQAEIDQFNKDNPSNFARKKLGLAPLTTEETQARQAQALALSQQKLSLVDQQELAKESVPPSIITVPNTNTTTTTVTVSQAPANTPIQSPDGADPAVNQQTELSLGVSVGTSNIRRDPASPTDDPFEAARLEREQELDNIPPTLTTDDVGEEDPFEARRLEIEQELNREELAEQAVEVEPGDDPFEARRLEIEQELDNPPPTLTAEDVGGELDAGAQAQLEFQQEQNRTLLEVENFQPEPVAFAPGLSDEEIIARQNPGGLSDEEIIARRQAAEQAAAKANALNQATLQSRYKQPGNTDWRVRLSLASSSSYLYNVLAAGSGDQGAGILAPLAQSNGVIFPYMPQISTLYRANYAQYDLVHSNFRGVYYQSSRVDDIQIRGTFTAQDTTEAAYLLAVIHFFRSVTKMFYGKDAERGTPPPLVYLSGLGDYQFSKHPCLVSQFSYTLPNDVDYIRATNPNDYGGNLLNRRTPTQTAPGGINFAGARRLANTLTPSGQPLPFGATPQTPQQNSVTGRVNNTGDFSTYVPTMMEIDITLIPVQTRSQVSKQFSLKDFANGNLLRGGFW